MKVWYALGSIIVLFFSILPQDCQSPTLQRGVSIDIARKYYSVDTLKKIIGTISQNNGDYLQLHFSDNQNYALTSRDMPHSEQSKLTKDDVKELLNYSNKHDVMIVPDIGFPSHAGALLAYLHTYNLKTYKSVVTDFDTNTLDYFDNPEALNLSKRYIKEVMDLFEQPRYAGKQRIVIGGDEVPGSYAHQSALIQYINRLAQTAHSKGYQPQIWNDSLTKKGITQLNSNISVLFWKQKDVDRSQQVSVEDLSRAGIQVFNYNAQTLYFLPSPKYSKEDIQKQQQYIKKHYVENRFNYSQEPHHLVSSTCIQGDGLSIWSEHAEGMSQQELLDQIQPLIKAYLKNIK